MSRLFTFGCSFTKYAWPTWADFLGLEFDEFENWGLMGIGNVGIANRITECIIKNSINENDTVIIQWTGHLRNDYHLFRHKGNKKRDWFGWKTKGSVFNYLNRDLYTKQWLYEFFDEKSFVMKNLNAIASVKLMLEKIGCKFKFTTIGDFEKLGSDWYDPNDFNENIKDENLWEKYPCFLPYKDALFSDKDLWVDPIGSFAWKHKNLLYEFYDKPTKVTFTDSHPSSELHMTWLIDYLKPKLNLNTEINDKQIKMLTDTKFIKKDTVTLLDFESVCEKTLENFNSSYIGY